MNFGSLIDSSPGKQNGKGNDNLNLNSLNGTVNSMTHGNNPINSSQGIVKPAMNVLDGHRGNDKFSMGHVSTDNIQLNINDQEGKKKGHHKKHNNNHHENNILNGVNVGNIHAGDIASINPGQMNSLNSMNSENYHNMNVPNSLIGAVGHQDHKQKKHRKGSGHSDKNKDNFSFEGSNIGLQNSLNPLNNGGVHMNAMGMNMNGNSNGIQFNMSGANIKGHPKGGYKGYHGQGSILGNAYGLVNPGTAHQLSNQLNTNPLNGGLNSQGSLGVNPINGQQINSMNGQINGQMNPMNGAQMNGQMNGQMNPMNGAQMNWQMNGQMNPMNGAQMNGQMNGQMNPMNGAQMNGQMNGQSHSPGGNGLMGNIHANTNGLNFTHGKGGVLNSNQDCCCNVM